MDESNWEEGGFLGGDRWISDSVHAVVNAEVPFSISLPADVLEKINKIDAILAELKQVQWELKHIRLDLELLK